MINRPTGLLALDVDLLAQDVFERCNNYDYSTYERIRANGFTDRDLGEAALALLMGSVLAAAATLDESTDDVFLYSLVAFDLLDGIIQTADEQGVILHENLGEDAESEPDAGAQS